MAERKPVSTRARFEVFKRDNFTCQYCGATPPAVVLHIDHITPVSKGGDNSKNNLVTSCDACNLGKSNIPLNSISKSMEETAKEIKEKEVQIKAFRKAVKAQEQREEDDAWQVVRALYGESRDSINRQYLTSIKTFLKKLPLHQVIRAADKAWVKGGQTVRFKYFCGICWNMIKQGGEQNG